MFLQYLTQYFTHAGYIEFLAGFRMILIYLIGLLTGLLRILFDFFQVKSILVDLPAKLSVTFRELLQQLVLALCVEPGSLSFKLNLAGFEGVASEDVIREGEKGEEIRKLIDEDEDIAVLVLGASTDPVGPGPLVASLAAGTAAGSFPIPVTIVPGNLDLEDIQALA